MSIKNLWINIEFTKVGAFDDKSSPVIDLTQGLTKSIQAQSLTL